MFNIDIYSVNFRIEEENKLNRVVEYTERILLDGTGDPDDWGTLEYIRSSNKDIQLFGLSTGVKHELDPNKLAHLNPNTTYFIPHSKAVKTLEIGDYQFSFSINSMILVTLEYLDNRIIATVEKYDGDFIEEGTVYLYLITPDGEILDEKNPNFPLALFHKEINKKKKVTWNYKLSQGESLIGRAVSSSGFVGMTCLLDLHSYNKDLLGINLMEISKNIPKSVEAHVFVTNWVDKIKKAILIQLNQFGNVKSDDCKLKIDLKLSKNGISTYVAENIFSFAKGLTLALFIIQTENGDFYRRWITFPLLLNGYVCHKYGHCDVSKSVTKTHFVIVREEMFLVEIECWKD